MSSNWHKLTTRLGITTSTLKVMVDVMMRMTKLIVRTVTGLLVMLMLQGCDDDAESSNQPQRNVNDVFDLHIRGGNLTAAVEIAPAIPANEQIDLNRVGVYSDAGDRIYDAIFARSQINACASDPEQLASNAGFISYEPDSFVLNAGAKRATFGWFIRVNIEQDQEEVVLADEYFTLFSYDLIDDDGQPLCATELFLFGPFDLSRNPIDPNPPPILEGLAVAQGGLLLAEVPLELAKVNNYDSDAPLDEAVLPGVSDDPDNRAGCMRCHSRSNDYPQFTVPFPWYAG